jgi:hypothetical protein
LGQSRRPSTVRPGRTGSQPRFTMWSIARTNDVGFIEKGGMP